MSKELRNRVICFVIPFCICFTIFLLQLSAQPVGTSTEFKLSWILYSILASIIPSILLGFIVYYTVRFFKKS